MNANEEDIAALVLVIDDDRAVCEEIAAVVHQIGHETHCAFTYRDGLEESRLREFALVIVDVQLPDGNGLDLLPRLREKRPSPEVIITTGHGDAEISGLSRARFYALLKKHAIGTGKIIQPNQLGAHLLCAAGITR